MPVYSYWPDTLEVLTELGFIPLRELTVRNLVAITNGETTRLVSPLGVLSREEKRVCRTFTRNTSKQQQFGTFPIDGSLLIGTGSDYQLVPSFFNIGQTRNNALPRLYNSFAVTDGSERALSALHRFFIAIQADGTVYTRVKDSKVSISFSFAKQGKVLRMELFCKALEEYGFTVTQTFTDVTRFHIVSPITCFKRFREWVNLSGKSRIWLQNFMNELSLWDSHIVDDGMFTYSNANTADIAIVQAVAALSGYRTRVSFQPKTGVYSVACYNKDRFNRMGMFGSEPVDINGRWTAVVLPNQKFGMVFRSNFIVFSGR